MEDLEQRRLTAIVFADVVSYSKLIQKNELHTINSFKSHKTQLFESILETRWPNLLQEVKGVRFRAMKNPQTPNVSVVLWEFPDNESMKKIEKLIEENIAKYVKTLAPKTVHFVGAVTQDFGETSF